MHRPLLRDRFLCGTLLHWPFPREVGVPVGFRRGTPARSQFRRGTPLVLAILALLALLLPAGASATSAATPEGPAAEGPAPADTAATPAGLDEADHLLTVGKYRDAIDHLEDLSERFPRDVEVRWRLGKAWVDLGETVPEDDEERRREYFGRGVSNLREAVELDPQHRDAVFNLAIAVGRDGLTRGAGDKVRASREVKELAERTIEIDPGFDGAYHLLGRWHREVESLGFFTRTLVKVVYGGFPEASYEQALEYFRRAYELKPRMAHLLEMGIVHEAMGNEERAREIYREVIDMQSDHVDAWLMRAEAQRRLDG